MTYFSERELGQKPRTEQVISQAVWEAIVAEFERLLNGNAFAECYPEQCPDGNGVYTTDRNSLFSQLKAEIGFDYPLATTCKDDSDWMSKTIPYTPDTFAILDFIEFVFRIVSKSENDTYHKFPNHYHFRFDKTEGQSNFVIDVNRLFARNGIAYELETNGKIKRVISEQLMVLMKQSQFKSGDTEFDNMLSTAMLKFTGPKPDVRYESLEKLWDAFERLKTFANPDKKSDSIKTIIEQVSSQPKFQQEVNDECTNLTRLGNQHLIRHSEKAQKKLESLVHIDYLFHRMLAMINLLLPSAIKLHKS
jgi:hypothetical protein